MEEPIFFKPVFQERIWGGTALKNFFGYHIPSEKTGECWAISGHANGETTVLSGEFQGKKLNELWQDHRDLFGNPTAAFFPMLVKLLDANSDLSVQVHPDDEYVQKKGIELFGKNECWYVLDCKDDAEIILGHQAKSKEELRRLIEKGEWETLLNKIPIQKGDFIYIPSGTIHALKNGTLILEIQQSSDTTFRLYDYGRMDDKGKKRELHQRQAIEVASVPHDLPCIQPESVKQGRNRFIMFMQSEHFSVYKWEIEENVEMKKEAPFLLVSVINGSGTLRVKDELFHVNKGDHFILPAAMSEFSLDGKFEAIVSHP